MASTPRANICDLPNEVVVRIFRFLPVADLARCAAMCDRWREIVTVSTDVWKGKSYSSSRSPMVCAEMRAVLCALPPFPDVTIESTDGFRVYIRYPRLIIHLKFVTVMDGFPTLRCECLSTRLDIAGDILTTRSTIDFERLRKMKILRIWSLNYWSPRIYSPDGVVSSAVVLCPNLTNLGICTDSLPAEHLDMAEGLSQLLTLKIVCSGLKKLAFLRHCSGTLEALQLVKCTSLPSVEFAHLRQLQNLRKLRLSDCKFAEGDLAVALAQLGTLESLELACCSLIQDLSVLQHCGHLQQLRITNTRVADHMVTAMPEPQRLHSLQLPTDMHTPLVSVVSVAVTAVDMPAALSRLQELGLPSSCLDYLGALLCCPQLRHICCEFTHGSEELDQLNVRIYVTFSSSES